MFETVRELMNYLQHLNPDEPIIGLVWIKEDVAELLVQEDLSDDDWKFIVLECIEDEKVEQAYNLVDDLIIVTNEWRKKHEVKQ